MPESKIDSIENKLHQAWKAERRFYNLRGIARLLIWVVALVLADFLIDWGIVFRSRMAGKVGFLLLIINVIILVWVLWRDWLRYLKPYNPLLVALDVEAKHPELASVLVSYTQLKGPLDNQPNVSSELIDAMRDQAIAVTKPLDFREVVDFGQLKKLLLVTGCVVLFFVGLGVNWQEHLGALLQRLAGVDVTYPTQTQINAVSGDLVVRMGDSTDVLAEVGGLIPDQGDLYFKYAEGKGGWKRAPMTKNPNKPAFSRQLKDVTRDLKYYVRINDDESKEYLIKVVASPNVVATEIQLSYPAYMNRPADPSDQLNLEVPEGTKILWKLKCDPAVKRMRVTFGENETIEADIDETGKNLSFSRVAEKGFKYTFHWTEDGSGKSFEYDDVQHSVRVVADTAPEVELLRPSNNGLATVQKTMKMMARANDDHGLSKAWLVYSVDGSAEQARVPIADFKGVPSEEFNYTWELKKSIEGLKPGSQITFAIEVIDLHPASEKHLSRSATRQISVVELETYLQWYREELAAQREEVKRARDTEQTSSTQVKQLKDQEAKDE
jgi:hypothetical protein